jgi:hypothetical protein
VSRPLGINVGALVGPLLPGRAVLSTTLAPRAFRTRMVTLWFLSTAIGTALSGVLVGYDDPSSQTPYSGILGRVALGPGLLLAAVAPALRRLMAGADRRRPAGVPGVPGHGAVRGRRTRPAPVAGSGPCPPPPPRAGTREWPRWPGC